MTNKTMADLRKEALLKQKMKKDDPVVLPMNEIFYQNMHDRIMNAVENIEIKKQPKWSKTWVFLERLNQNQKS